MSEERQLRTLQVGGTPIPVREGENIEARYSEYKQLTARAVEVFGDEQEAARWLSSANRDLNGQTPLQDFIENGPIRVLGILGRIEHGVFF